MIKNRQCIAHYCLILLFGLLFGQSYAQDQSQSGDYRLGAGDVIRILVFQNPDLTMEARVSESGTISYPLIGVVNLGGLTIRTAEEEIARQLKAGGFVKQPQVNVVLMQNRGNQVSVLGQVNRPGRYPLETFNIRLSEVLAIAGGVASNGSDVVILSGARNGQPFRKEIDIPGLFVEERVQEDPIVAGGDMVYVNRAPMFYIYGEAQRPGTYRIERGMTVQQALATGGGPTQRGMEYMVRLHRRTVNGSLEKISPNKEDRIQDGDVLYVRESLF